MVFISFYNKLSFRRPGSSDFLYSWVYMNCEVAVYSR
jgi:hypothetical protein